MDKFMNFKTESFIAVCRLNFIIRLKNKIIKLVFVQNISNLPEKRTMWILVSSVWVCKPSLRINCQTLI